MKDSIQKKTTKSRSAAENAQSSVQRKEAKSIQLMPEEEELQMKAEEPKQLQEEEELPM